MSKEESLLVFDIGTTGVKCVIFDTGGVEIGSATVVYSTYYPYPGWAEQDPEELWAGVVGGIKKLSEQGTFTAHTPTAIGLSGHMNGMLPVDKDGAPVYREIIHSDSRSEANCEEISNRITDDAFFEITGNRIDAHLSLPKIVWFQQNRTAEYKRTAFILQSKDYIASKLTGSVGQTDYSDASLTCALNITRREWDSSLLKELELDIDKFPGLGSSHEMVGRVSKEASALTGLKAGTPVYRGGGDAACSTRGAGIYRRNRAQMYIGSSAWITALAEKPLLDSGRRIQNFYDLEGKWCNVCGTVQSAGNVVEWIVEALGYKEQALDTSGNDLFEYIDRQAEKSPAGAHSLLFFPYLMGERTPHWNQDLRGALIGFSLSHSRNDITRAGFEGVAYALRNVLEVFHENSMYFDHLTLIGGGAKSPFWSQMLSDVLEADIHIPAAPRIATALGAAIAAGVGSGVYNSYEEAAKIISIERQVFPNAQLAPIYSRQFKLFSEMYKHLWPVYRAMNNKYK